MTILTFIIVALLLSFAVAALFDFLHGCIGAPSANDDGIASAHTGFIFSAYGLWVCRKYNAARQKRRDALLAEAMQRKFSDAELDWAKSSLATKLSYKNNYSDAEILNELQQNYFAHLIANDAGWAALNWYKPLGVCISCTLFWLATILCGVMLFALSFWQTIPTAAVVFTLLYFAPVSIKFFFIVNR
jgi:hypothetical protein